MAVILALDPGTKNYGYALIKVTGSRVSLLKAGQIFTTLYAPNKDARRQFNSHSTAIRQLIKFHGVTHVIAERYMSRRMGGTTIESVNMMLGAIAEICLELSIYFKFIPASQWKNEVNREHPEYLLGEYLLGKPLKITPHTVDAVMIGVYGLGVMQKQNAYAGRLVPGKVIGMITRIGVTHMGTLKELRELTKKPKRKKRRLA